MRGGGQPPSFDVLAQASFAKHLTQHRAFRPQTVAAYRDALVLFLDLAQPRLGKLLAEFAPADMTPELITTLFKHPEPARHNCLRSRNARLAAPPPFLKLAGHRDASPLHLVGRALDISMKRRAQAG